MRSGFPRPGSTDELGFLLLLCAFSYVFGGVQAILTGLAAVLSFGANDYGRVSVTPVLGTATVTGLAFLAITWGWRGTTLWSMIGMLALHIGAALGAWLIVTVVLAARDRSA